MSKSIFVLFLCICLLASYTAFNLGYTYITEGYGLIPVIAYPLGVLMLIAPVAVNALMHPFAR